MNLVFQGFQNIKLVLIVSIFGIWDKALQLSWRAFFEAHVPTRVS